MHVIICGGRDYQLTRDDQLWLKQLVYELDITRVHEGGARGVDTAAHNWAKAHGLSVSTHRADWNTHGKAAGPIRNGKMLCALQSEAYDEDIAVIAFPGGRGTADMVARARRAGVRVIIREAA